MQTINISITDHIRHYLNPLHVMCRLIGIGINRKTAKKIVKRYEVFFKAILG